MPFIRGGPLVHLPGEAERAAKAAKQGRYRRKAGRKAKTAHGNATSKPAFNEDAGRKFGTAPPKAKGPPKYENPEEQEIRDISRPNMRLLGGVVGLTAGANAGAAVGSKVGDKKYPDAKKLYKAMVNPFKVKEPVHLITDMGTKAGRAEAKTPKGPKRWPELPRKTIAGSAVVGAGLGYKNAVDTKKAEQQLYRKKKRRAEMAKNDPFNIEKLRPKPTKEERHKFWYNKDFTPAGPYNHGERKIAAKIASKERGKGLLRGAAVGAAGGAAVGAGVAAASKGRIRPKVSTAAGAVVGGVSGEWRGVYTGDIKGQRKYKKVIGKNMTVSAFGVDHADLSKAMPSFGKIGMAAGKKVSQAGIATQKAGGKAAFAGAVKRTTSAMGNPGAKNAAKGAAGFGQQKAGQAGMKLGGGMRQMGSAMQKNPSATGVGLAAGGTGLGIGGAYSIFNPRKNKPPVIAKSAFGVEIAKADKKLYKPNKKEMSTGRAVTGTAFAPVHGLVAGKGAGGKARSVVAEGGGTMAGGMAGSVAGALVSRGNPMAARTGSVAGSITGAYQGTKYAHKKGWLKREKVRPRD